MRLHDHARHGEVDFVTHGESSWVCRRPLLCAVSSFGGVARRQLMGLDCRDLCWGPVPPVSFFDDDSSTSYLPMGRNCLISFDLLVFEQ